MLGRNAWPCTATPDGTGIRAGLKVTEMTLVEL